MRWTQFLYKKRKINSVWGQLEHRPVLQPSKPKLQSVGITDLSKQVFFL
jgi:hypothetical protein